MKILIFTICIFLTNYALAKESRVFSYDPAYFDNEGNIVYAKTIEEYAKDNNDYIDENTITDNPYLRGNDTISDFKNRTTTYINKIYDKLKNTQQKCIPLASANPTYNPYHKLLVIGIDARIPNARNVTGVVVNLPDSLGSFQPTTTGNIESNTDTLTDEISNTIEVASTLTDGNIITHSDSNTNTSSLEVAVTLTHSNSTSESSNNGFTFNTKYSEAIIHGVTEDDTHAITNIAGSTDEINWNGYKEHSDTNEYSYF
ncbi:hypothetical protein H8356DRAFT_1274637 [Neocallimastix lanati (nom. inval.)]|nr:hypothetical protein H8356DRAFT_1274637 [Neocallimastix sp. JGI-2020a]